MHLGYKGFLNFILILFIFSTAFGQNENDQAVQLDQVYQPNIRSVQFYNSAVVNSYPIIQLNAGERVTLTFDEINAKQKDYQFTVIHCDANWQPSQLIKSEYIDGIFTDYLPGGAISTNTYKSFVYYKMNFPTANTRLKMSGNYILKIYTENENAPVLTRRFYVYSNAASISAQVIRANYNRYSDTKQQVNFTINTNNLSITDPYNDVKVVIRQNGRKDNEIRGLRPQLVENKNLVYNYDEENLFDGGNEFRAFDITDVRLTGIGVRYFTFDSIYHATLFGDEDRSPNVYTTYIDQDGQFSINTKQGANNSTEADYMWVYFRLKAVPEPNQDIYIFGALTNWQIDRRFKMTYIARDGEYQGLALLKQGYYDYMYATVSDKGEINTATLEGNHWETENNYTILVYLRPTGQNFDLLVGKGSFNSQLK